MGKRKKEEKVKNVNVKKDQSQAEEKEVKKVPSPSAHVGRPFGALIKSGSGRIVRFGGRILC